ncbi:plant invertase/pectin methylesterase inhibitor family protein, partial [Pasteurella multocida]|nr:plant invertase/pectin methylesterase inhibitor family protein [Pasteurella multocida]
MCQNTEDQKLCHDTLSSVKDADPKAYLGAAVEATTNSVIKALNMSDRLAVERGSNSAGIKMALDDCKDLLQSALDSLEASANLLKSNNIQGISDQSPDFRNWLSSVISYQQSCMDGFDDNKDGEKEIKEILQSQGNLDEMGKLTGIALDIAADLSKILEQFGLKLDVKPA